MSASTELLKGRADLTSMSLYTVVKVKEDADNFWKEVADVISISASRRRISTAAALRGGAARLR